MPGNDALRAHKGPAGPREGAASTVQTTGAVPLLAPAGVAGPLCGRSEASWWRDHAARRVPRPIKLGGRTLWRLEELRRWVEAGCPCRSVWEALEQARSK
jgi:predicted DNA-binding transcriptional regulator AlpA